VRWIVVVIVSGLFAGVSVVAEAEPAEGPSVGAYVGAELLHRDDFDKGLSNWQVEQQPGGTAKVIDGKLDVDDKAGCTIWFKQKLETPVMVEFDVTMIKAGGPNDRVSDLNSFIMATDPKDPDLLAGGAARKGKFSNYHGLRLYYVGYGANNNRTVRFRRYTGDGKRPLLPEHDLKAKHKPNVVRRVRIIVVDGVYQYWIDGERVYDITDDEPYTSGWFGFRTVRNHMKIDRFRVWRVKRGE